MPTPEQGEQTPAAAAAVTLRTNHESGGPIGSAMLRAIDVLRRERFDNEATNLEGALLQLADFALSDTHDAQLLADIVKQYQMLSRGAQSQFDELYPAISIVIGRAITAARASRAVPS